MVKMSHYKPYVSIGIPVYNGEKYLEETLISAQSQTYGDLELIISDNNSTDRTQEICREFAASDKRIRYQRNTTNIGPTRNFNRAFVHSSGKYFKWWAYDDLCAPEYLERCVQILDEDPSVVVCHPKTSIIDEHGRFLGDYDDQLHFRSKKPRERFRDYLFRSAGMWNAIYGVIRVSEFKKTPLHGHYLGADQVLLGELILRGELHQVKEHLFYRRNHSDQSWRAHAKPKEMLAWLSPTKKSLVRWPISWKHFYEYLKAIWRSGLDWHEEVRCCYYLSKWLSKEFIRPVFKPLKAFLTLPQTRQEIERFGIKANPWDSPLKQHAK